MVNQLDLLKLNWNSFLAHSQKEYQLPTFYEEGQIVFSFIKCLQTWELGDRARFCGPAWKDTLNIQSRE